MADAGRLRDRLDSLLRETTENQARAYCAYGALLDRLAAKDIPTVEFAREAIDLYMGAVGKAASTGVTALGEAFSAGMQGVRAAADTAAPAQSEAVREPKPAVTSGVRRGSAKIPRNG